MIEYANLTSKQREAFDLYKANSPFAGKQCFADHLNDELRHGNKLKPEWEEKAQELDSIRDIDDSAIERTLFRATFDDFVSLFISNDIMEYPAFLSTSTDDDHALQRHYANYFKERIPVKLEIYCPSTTKVIPMESNASHGGHEKEVLIARNSVFKVIDKTEVTDQVDINRVMSGLYGQHYSTLYMYKLEFIKYA